MARAATTDPWRVVPPDEFRARQDAVRERCDRQGLAGAVVWSRGGAFVDMCADVLYLTNHYSQQPYAGDEAGIGKGRSHGVVVIPVEGPTYLIADTSYWRPDLAVYDEVIVSTDVPAAAASAVRSARLDRSALALVGASYMTAAAYLGLVEHLSTARFERVDGLVEDLRIRKSENELALVRRSAVLGNATVEALMEAVVEGATEAEAAAAAVAVLVAGGGVLYDAACASGRWSTDFTRARLPSADHQRPLERGDLFHVDCYGSFGGYFFDFARSRCVGDEPSADQRLLLETAIGAVEAMADAARAGQTAGDLFAVGDGFLRDSEFRRRFPPIDRDVVSFPAYGHGLGMGWERPYIQASDPFELEPNMYLAIEVQLAHDSVGGVMFEHDVLVTEGEPEILTTARSRWW
jgi:Xaa-Pro aminopeptidase